MPVELVVGALPPPLRPGDVPARIPLEVRVGCGYDQPQPDTWQISVVVAKSAPFVETALDPATGSIRVGGTDQAQCVLPEARQVFHTNLTIAASRDAPAFTTFSTELVATVADNTPPMASQSARASFELMADYYPSLMVSTPRRMSLVEPGQIAAFPIMVTNLGNGETSIEFRLLTTGDNGLDVVMPELLVLQSKQQGATFNMQGVLVETRPIGSDVVTNEVIRFQVQMTSKSTSPLATGGATNQTQEFVLHVQGIGKDLPGIGAVQALSVVALSVFLLSLSRRIRRV